ncbi:MAG: hypothetical protein IJA95_08360 [Bacteroidaceae bacterium]|nr:hypothetical protein [Bacteroidaceae bacterium]
MKELDKKCDIELLSDNIWVKYRIDSIRGSLFSRQDGSVVCETTLGTALQISGFEFNDEVSTLFRLDDETTWVSSASKIRGIKRHWLSVSVDALTGEHTDTIAFPLDDGVEYFRLDNRYVLRKHRIIGDDILPSFKLDWYTSDLSFIKQDVFPDTVFQTFQSWNQTKVHLLKDKVYFHFPTMRTIYQVSAEHSPIPLYRYNVGNHRHAYHQIKDVAKYWEAERKGKLSCYAIRTSLIAENYVFGGFNYKGMIHWVLFDRNTHQTWVIPTQSTVDYRSLEGIKNDLDGGFDFWPRKISKNGEIYTWYTVKELKDKVAQSNPEHMKNPEVAQKLKKMLDNLPKDVNVIVAVLKERTEPKYEENSL